MKIIIIIIIISALTGMTKRTNEITHVKLTICNVKLIINVIYFTTAVVLFSTTDIGNRIDFPALQVSSSNYTWLVPSQYTFFL
jgi:hypothetical protein